MTARLVVAEREDIRVVTAAVTILEADRPAVHPARLDWVLSRLEVIPVTRDIACLGAKLLRTAGLFLSEMVIPGASVWFRRGPLETGVGGPEHLR